MFKKLKRKFVLLATVATFILVLIIVAVMNIINYISIVQDSDEVLKMLSQTQGQFQSSQQPEDVPGDVPEHNDDFSLPHGMSPEVPYESRYFIALLNSDGEVVRSDLTNIITVDDDLLKKYAAKAFKSSQNTAFLGDFRYTKSEDGELIRILFLDCGRKLDSFRNFLLISSLVGVGGCLIVFILFLFVAGKIVRPISESYEKQKRFITDAGHEIKTPLTIINTNLDLLTEDLGEKDELSDIRLQTKQLTNLTNDLVMLSKMEESGNTMTKIELPASDIVSETVSSFSPVAQAKNISLSSQVEPNVTLHGLPNSIRQLVSILLENAIKYTPNNGFVSLNMSVQKKNWVFSVYNSTENKIVQEELSHVFDRFYRADSSRNSETGGHGIGLSIAKAITDAHGGTILASTKGGCDFSITVSLPL